MGRITKYSVTIPSTAYGSTVSGTTGVSGPYVGYTPVINGFIHAITHSTNPATTGPQLSSTGILTIGTEKQTGTTGIFQGPIGTAPLTYFPRAIHQTSSGGASTDATLHYDRFAVSEDRLLISSSNLNTTTLCSSVITIIVEGV